jgi:hypothetical protein
MRKFVIETPRTWAVFCSTTVKPWRSKTGRAVRLAYVSISEAPIDKVAEPEHLIPLGRDHGLGAGPFVGE